MDRTDLIILVIGIASFAVAGLGLVRRKVLGMAFRGRFIARREQEPVLYWASIFGFAGWGMMMTYLVWLDNFGR